MEINTHGGNSVVAILSQLLDDPDLEIRTVVTEGLCKLLLCGAIASPKLFSRYMLLAKGVVVQMVILCRTMIISYNT